MAMEAPRRSKGSKLPILKHRLTNTIVAKLSIRLAVPSCIIDRPTFLSKDPRSLPPLVDLNSLVE